MLLPHHVFTVVLTENSKVLIENSVSTFVFTKVLTVFAVCGVVIPNVILTIFQLGNFLRSGRQTLFSGGIPKDTKTLANLQ